MSYRPTGTKKMIFLGLFCIGFWIATFFITPNVMREYKDFKENAYKVSATITHVRVSEKTYSPVYSYKDSNNDTITVSSNVYRNKKYKVGDINYIYVNPNYPEKYYTNSFDILFTGIFFPLFAITISFAVAREIKEEYFY